MVRRGLARYQKRLQDALIVTDRPIAAPLREERGEMTVPQPEAMNGADGTMTVRWHFALLS